MRCIICIDRQYYTLYNISITTQTNTIRKGVDDMVFNTGAALLDAIVLAAVSKDRDGTYGYKITQDVRRIIEISESTLYPVLRRLQKDDCLEVYDMECGGRNRRYYKVTEKGEAQLQLYKTEWNEYSAKISSMFTGGENNE
jgi:PadR family transcriptional regulator, regulatory protein PadR